MNYEDLTERIEKAEKEKKKGRTYLGEDWWSGYICALNDVRNDMNTGGKK